MRPETRARIGEALRRKWDDPEYRERLSRSHRERFADGAEHGMRGRSHSDESRARMREAHARRRDGVVVTRDGRTKRISSRDLIEHQLNGWEI